MYPYQNLFLEDMPGEIWDVIPECEGRYMASTEGRIKRLAYECGNIHFREKILVQNPSNNNYLSVCINQRRALVSRLVALTFIPNPENKPTVDHINGNTLDNRLCNLRWATYAENANNPVSRERLLKWARNGGVLRGEKHYRSIPIVGINTRTNEIRRFVSSIEAGSVVGSDTSVRRRINKKTKARLLQGWLFFRADDPELKAYLTSLRESQGH